MGDLVDKQGLMCILVYTSSFSSDDYLFLPMREYSEAAEAGWLGGLVSGLKSFYPEGVVRVVLCKWDGIDWQGYLRWTMTEGIERRVKNHIVSSWRPV